MSDRVAIYGGSFDPVHLGHLWVAQHALESLKLDRILFVPAATSPLKPHGPVASDLDREQMLRLALADTADGRHQPTMVVDDRELRRGGVSYSLDTVRAIRGELPTAELFLLVGSDAFASIRQWHRPAELLGLITPCVFHRGGDAEIDWQVLDGLVSPARIEEIRHAELRLPLIEVSSGDIRSRVAQGREIRFLVPAAVRKYIGSRSLYQPIESPS